MKKENELKRRLSAFGLRPVDLSADQLKRARRDVSGNHTGGFFASDELISLSLKKRCK